MKQNPIEPAFVIGGLAAIHGTLVRIDNKAEEDDYSIWYLVEPLYAEDRLVESGWYPLEMMKEVESVNIGFNGNDETQLDPVNAEDLMNLFEGFCRENDFRNPRIDYMEPILKRRK